ncbi:hypothetical protein [Roseovarius spongiae]|uniref:hypothetical protein n=1 Tax=Roseovarius spongiae TaxID=2320272 RepID=UPI001FEBF5C5|nr:hypothetical protein [Roseovarius spongiae]
MTNQTNPADFGTTGNVTSLPNSVQVARQPAEMCAALGEPDGMSSDFSLTTGVFQFRLEDDEDVLPVRIWSPMIVEGICRAAKGGRWGRVVLFRSRTESGMNTSSTRSTF